MDELRQFITKQPCYEQHIIEIKKIYESRLISILVPGIYDGFRSLYNISEQFEKKFEEQSKIKSDVERMSVLVIFQKLISNLPNLSVHKIKSETDRIKTSTRSADIFDDLLKAVIKANITLLTYNVDQKRKELLQTRYHESIIAHDFVHSCYIESARSFYSRPELFWKGHNEITINQNKRLCYEIIEKSIRESINTALPMKEILSEYLNNPYEMKSDIRIYVIGDANPKNINLDDHDVSKYPENLPSNQQIAGFADGVHITRDDPEFVDAEKIINRDLGVKYDISRVDSLLQSDSVSDHFDSHGGDNNSENNNDPDNDNHSDDNRVDESNTDTNTDGEKNESSEKVVDGIKMVDINNSITNKNKGFFNSLIPEAQKKASKHQDKVRKEINNSLSSGNNFDDGSKKSNNTNSTNNTENNEKQKRTISEKNDDLDNDEESESGSESESNSDIEEMLHGILKNKK